LRWERGETIEAAWVAVEAVAVSLHLAIGRFIVDFYCPEQRLIIEIDGEVHRDQTERDEARMAALEVAGYRTQNSALR
jgi:very-short-patch-repair endonuclease